MYVYIKLYYDVFIYIYMPAYSIIIMDIGRVHDPVVMMFTEELP